MLRVRLEETHKTYCLRRIGRLAAAGSDCRFNRTLCAAARDGSNGGEDAGQGWRLCGFRERDKDDGDEELTMSNITSLCCWSETLRDKNRSRSRNEDVSIHLCSSRECIVISPENQLRLAAAKYNFKSSNNMCWWGHNLFRHSTNDHYY
jgi:hypothetical protein